MKLEANSPLPSPRRGDIAPGHALPHSNKVFKCILCMTLLLMIRCGGGGGGWEGSGAFTLPWVILTPNFMVHENDRKLSLEAICGEGYERIK